MKYFLFILMLTMFGCANHEKDTHNFIEKTYNELNAKPDNFDFSKLKNDLELIEKDIKNSKNNDSLQEHFLVLKKLASRKIVDNIDFKFNKIQTNDSIMVNDLDSLSKYISMYNNLIIEQDQKNLNEINQNIKLLKIEIQNFNELWEKEMENINTKIKEKIKEKIKVKFESELSDDHINEIYDELYPDVKNGNYIINYENQKTYRFFVTGNGKVLVNEGWVIEEIHKFDVKFSGTFLLSGKIYENCIFENIDDDIKLESIKIN